MSYQKNPSRTATAPQALVRLTSMRWVTVGAIAAQVVAVLAWGALIFEAPTPVRAVAGLALVLFAPGYCVAVLARVSDPVMFAVVTVAASASLCLLVSLALFYLSVGSGATSVALISGLTLILALVVQRDRTLS